jgi:hypothetical protein
MPSWKNWACMVCILNRYIHTYVNMTSVSCRLQQQHGVVDGGVRWQDEEEPGGGQDSAPFGGWAPICFDLREINCPWMKIICNAGALVIMINAATLCVWTTKFPLDGEAYVEISQSYGLSVCPEWWYMLKYKKTQASECWRLHIGIFVFIFTSLFRQVGL